MNQKITLIFLATLLWLNTAYAGFEESYKALQTKEYQTALTEALKGADAKDVRAYFLLGNIYQNGLGVNASPIDAFIWYEKAAKGGVVSAVSKLAMAYNRGEGVAIDKEKAITLARFAAKNNDPEGLFLVYIFLSNSSLGYLDSTGHADDTKYHKLASRPISDRVTDTEAYDALYRSAEKDYPLAKTMLALNFGGVLGEGNRKRMDKLLEKLQVQKTPALENYEKISRYMDNVGASYTTPQLFSDSQVTAMLAATIKACGLDKEKASKSRPKLITTKISKPLSSATYLPSNVVGYEKAYLVSGTWEEEWKYEVCETSIDVIVQFVADGLGGAKFFTDQTLK